jgi:hypothetical protein
MLSSEVFTTLSIGYLYIEKALSLLLHIFYKLFDILFPSITITSGNAFNDTFTEYIDKNTILCFHWMYDGKLLIPNGRFISKINNHYYMVQVISNSSKYERSINDYVIYNLNPFNRNIKSALSEIEKAQELNKKISVYICEPSTISWRYITRDLEYPTVHVNDKLNKFIYDTYRKTISNKYKTCGILLYGEPGCGKSTAIKCIAHKLGMDIYYANEQNFSITRMQRVSDKSLVVVEDCSYVINKLLTDGDDKLNRSAFNANFNVVLNFMSGILVKKDMLFVFTDNNIESLLTNELCIPLFRQERIYTLIEVRKNKTFIVNRPIKKNKAIKLEVVAGNRI